MFNLLRPRSVASAVSSFQKHVDNLLHVAAVHQAKAQRHEEKIESLLDKIDFHSEAMSKADDETADALALADKFATTFHLN